MYVLYSSFDGSRSKNPFDRAMGMGHCLFRPTYLRVENLSVMSLYVSICFYPFILAYNPPNKLFKFFASSKSNAKLKCDERLCNQ